MNAQNYIDLGFFLFPLKRDKKQPAFIGWQEHATQDASAIAAWEDEGHPLGLYTGKSSHGGAFLILDIDVGNGKTGEASLLDLQIEYGELPPTREHATPSGGRHLVFKVPHPLRQRKLKYLGFPDIDIRSGGGLVVMPGCDLGKGPYTVLADRPIADAPPWLIEFLGKKKEKAVTRETGALDSPQAVARAIDYLRGPAPEAVEYSNGNDTTYAVACRVINLGCSAPRTLELMLDHYNNEKAIPPWNLSDLEEIVDHAFDHNQDGAGSLDPKNDFKDAPLSLIPELKTTPPLAFKALDPFDESAIPPRQWLLGRVLLKEKVTVLIAPPGVGKSTATIAWAFSVATNRADIAGMDVYAPGNVLIINNEDDEDELKRRLAAVRRHHNIAWDALAGRVFIYSGVERPFLIATQKAQQEGIKRGKDMDDLVAYIKDRNISLVIADPFLETHEADENDNRQINQVARFYREVAASTGCAVCLVHHTRKAAGGRTDGHIGNMDSGRGASSLTGVARIVMTLYDMTEKDAARYSIAEENRHLYVRLDDAKANLSLKSSKARWYKKVGIRLANEDEVGVLEPIELQETVVTEQNDILEAMANWDVFSEFRQRTWLPIKQAAKLLKENNCLSVSELSERTVVRHLEKLFQADGLSNGTIMVWHEKHLRDGQNASLLYCEVLDLEDENRLQGQLPDKNSARAGLFSV